MSTRQKKSKAKRRQPTMRDLRVLREITEFDPNGIEVTHHRTVDTLGMMLESGAITSAMHAAARDFQAAFTIACFDNMPKVNLMLMARPAPASISSPIYPIRRSLRANALLMHSTHWAATARRRVMRLACHRDADFNPRVGASPGLGRTAGSAGKRAGYFGRGARRAREALWHPRRRAPVCMSRIVTWGSQRARHGGHKAAPGGQPRGRC